MTSDNNNVIEVQFGKKNTKPAHRAATDAENPELDARNAEKKVVFESFLDSNSTAMIFLDATQADVRVPKMFQNERDLRLNFCLEYRIPEFCVDSQGVRGTLSFQEGFAFCDIPWKRIFAIRNVETGDIYTWKEDIPNADPEPEKPSERPNLRLLTLDED